MSEPSTAPRVVITGAAGAIGTVLAGNLSRRWRLRLTDLQSGDGIDTLDVTDPSACREAFVGADAVVHLAGNPEPESDWLQLYEPNVLGAYAVIAAARECRVPRLVVASSLHTVSGTVDGTQRRETDAPRPGNLYGATKAWAEALGGWVAATSATSVAVLRIGYVAERPPSEAEVGATERAAWLSHRDCVALVRAAVEAPFSGIVIVNGISGNRYRIAELGNAAHQIGYQPVDDAWRAKPGARLGR